MRRVNCSMMFECPLRLHMRPADAIANLVDKYDAVTTISMGGNFASAASVMDVLSLSVERGDQIRLTAIGVDCERVLDALRILLLSFTDSGLPPIHLVDSGPGVAAA